MKLRNFLAHAVKLESAAEQCSDSIADAMETLGNPEVETFFRHLGRLLIA